MWDRRKGHDHDRPWCLAGSGSVSRREWPAVTPCGSGGMQPNLQPENEWRARMRRRLLVIAGLALLLAYSFARQDRQTEEGAVEAVRSGVEPPTGRGVARPTPIHQRAPSVAGDVAAALPLAGDTEHDTDPTAVVADTDAREEPAEVGGLLEPDDDVALSALEPGDVPAESDPPLDADDAVGMSTGDVHLPPSEVGPSIDADEQDAVDTFAENAEPISVGPELSADAGFDEEDAR